MKPVANKNHIEVNASPDKQQRTTPRSNGEELWRKIRHALRVLVDSTRYRARQAMTPQLRAAVTSPEDALSIEQCIDWLRNYIGQPHPELGRAGDICPFVTTALNRGRMSFHVYGKITTISPQRLKLLLIDEGLRLKKRLNPSDSEVELTTVNILLPNLEESDFEAVHDAHTLCKTTLMRRGIMIAVFYPNYQRPGVLNPAFKLYVSPYPIVTIRPMALHDIAFLERNEEGFNEYRRRFAKRYESGRVPEKYGYIERYNAAMKRFAIEQD